MIHCRDFGMLNPRSAPKIHRQNDTWHVRIYVAKPVVRLADAEIADVAHRVCPNYREEMVSDMAEFFQLSSTKKTEAIPEEDRSAVLHALFVRL